MARINLGWGGGGFDILLDLRSKQLVRYSSTEEAAKVHEVYGGKNYYQSRSGMSGAGWIPGHMALRSVSTYRVDSAFVQSPPLSAVPNTLPGLKVIAPISYGGGNVPHEWPIAVVKGFREGYKPPSGDKGPDTWDHLYLLDNYGLSMLLAGREGELEDREMTIQYVPSIWADATERTFNIRIRPDTHLGFRRALIGLFNHELAFNSENEEEQGNPFWGRLGIKIFRGRLYKVAQNVCRASYSREELSTVETLQAVVPGNVLVLAPNLYLQESSGFLAVGLFNIDGQEVESEESLETPDAIRAMVGDFQDVLARLETGARRKIEEDRRQAEEQARYEAEMEEAFQVLCRKCANLTVSVEEMRQVLYFRANRGDARRYRAEDTAIQEEFFTGAHIGTVAQVAQAYTNLSDDERHWVRQGLANLIRQKEREAATI